MAARRGKYQEAESHFRKALQLGRPTPDLLNDMGYAYYLQGELRKAEYMHREALALDPSHAGANNNLGLVLGEQGRFQESLAAFKRTVTDAEAYANLAYVHAQLGDLDEAVAHYSHALTLDKELSRAAKAMVQVAETQQIRRQLTLPVETTSVAAATPVRCRSLRVVHHSRQHVTIRHNGSGQDSRANHARRHFMTGQSTSACISSNKTSSPRTP